MSEHSANEVLFALAGIFQNCQCVVDLAHHGRTDEHDIESAIYSLEQLDAETTEAIYKGREGIYHGLRILQRQLPSGASGDTPDLGRYVVSVMNLERNLNKDLEMQRVIATRITQIKRLHQNSEVLEDNRIKAYADLYKETISTFATRIQVTGNPDYLKQPIIQDKIRCSLFSAIRSAVLWRQLGGKRRHLIFKRKAMISAVNQLLTGH